MKKFVLLCLGLCAIKVDAQISIVRADMPKPISNSPLPDSVIYTNVTDPTTATAHLTTGANASWNESALIGTRAVQQFVPMSSTPLTFQLVFLSCDYAQPLLGSNNIAGSPLTDAYEYYNYSTANDRLEIKGFGGNLTIPNTTTPIPIPALYSSADVLYRFPLDYGDIDSSNSAFDVTVPLGIIDIQVKREQKRVNHVDGWGTLQTPTGTFNTLRVYSYMTRVDSIITPIFSVGVPSNPVEYKWLAKGEKIPVLQINGTDLNGTFTPTAVTFKGEIVVPNALTDSKNANAVICTNPVLNNCSIDFELKQNADVDFYLLNVDGTQVGEFHYKNMAAGQHHELLPLSQLPSATYVIQCRIADQVIAKKIIKL